MSEAPEKTTMRLGIDVGGTKIEAIALSAGNDILERTRTATPRDDYSGTIRTIVTMVQSIEDKLGYTGTVGVGIPGTVDRLTGLVKNANSTWLNGRPFDRDVAQALGRDIKMANDANCFALSEAVDGAAQGAGTVFGVIVGTGCGGGLVVNGKVLEGGNGIAGEWGHNPLPHPRQDECPGPSCYCGLKGCVETWLSGPGLSARFEEMSGRSLTAEEVSALAMNGDAAAQTCMQHYYDRFARALSVVVNVVDPDVVVLGGGMSNIDAIYDEVPPLLPKYAMSPVLNTRLVRHKHGDSSGVRGAAWLWSMSE